MKPRRPALSLFAAPSLALITLAITGCAVQTEGPTGPSENPTAAGAGLTRPKCAPGEHLESTTETAGGKVLWYCVSDASSPPPPAPTSTNTTLFGPPAGTAPANCTGTLPIPAELAGQGCFPGTFIQTLTQPLPIFYCPTTAILPYTLGYAGTRRQCSGKLGITTLCVRVWSFAQISNSCVSDAAPGWEYVTEGLVGDDGGGNCRGGCSSIPPPPP